MKLKTSERWKLGGALIAISAQVAAGPAAAFCGFYVAQADSKLFNKASKVVLTRDGGQTAITTASDYQGDAKEFARRPRADLHRAQADRRRRHEDDRPYRRVLGAEARGVQRRGPLQSAAPASPDGDVGRRADANARHCGVGRQSRRHRRSQLRRRRIRRVDPVGQESDGLVAWLTENGYKIPTGAGAVLGSYIKQNMHFFVAKVNLGRMKLIGAGYLRPLQVRYHTAKFMLPLRLGTVNANGPQDLIVYALTRNGRVEAVNYPDVKVPTGMDVPLYVRDEFGPFYKAIFDRAVAKEQMRAVFVEYAWNMGNCDPCSAPPMLNKELVELGARWIGDASDEPVSWGVPAYVTRLHVRYDAKSFPEDIAFEETADANNFQGRYVLRHPWRGEANCSAGREYRAQLPAAFARQAENLIELTGWPRKEVEARMALTGQPRNGW
jgi:hypothetical protein